MIGLAEELSEKGELHRFLGTLLSNKLKVDQKLEILENEYDISMEKSLEEDVKIMCNLSEGIEERAMESGKKELLKQLVEKKLAKGKSVEVIADELEEEVSAIQPVIDEIRMEGK